MQLPDIACAATQYLACWLPHPLWRQLSHWILALKQRGCARKIHTVHTTVWLRIRPHGSFYYVLALRFEAKHQSESSLDDFRNSTVFAPHPLKLLPTGLGDWLRLRLRLMLILHSSIGVVSHSCKYATPYHVTLRALVFHRDPRRQPLACALQPGMREKTKKPYL